MRIVYSEKVNKLFDLIEPYIEWNKFPAKLKSNTPENIQKAYIEWRRLTKEEKEVALKANGLI